MNLPRRCLVTSRRNCTFNIVVSYARTCQHIRARILIRARCAAMRYNYVSMERTKIRQDTSQRREDSRYVLQKQIMRLLCSLFLKASKRNAIYMTMFGKQSHEALIQPHQIDTWLKQDTCTRYVGHNTLSSSLILTRSLTRRSEIQRLPRGALRSVSAA